MQLYSVLSEHGYLTGMTEDAIWDGPFQYRLKGFKIPPTEFYPRPFFLDIARRTKYPTDRCINNRNVPQIHFEYVRTVFNSFPKRLKFLVSFNGKLRTSYQFHWFYLPGNGHAKDGWRTFIFQTFLTCSVTVKTQIKVQYF